MRFELKILLRVMFVVVICCLNEQLPGAVRQPAFPTAEGFGAWSAGGRGGTVVFVTTLEDYHPLNNAPIPGSLRAACNMNGPRTIIFRVAGYIDLEAPLTITEPYLTLAGQTAPGDGICIRNYATNIKTHDVIIRYLRFRPGDRRGSYHVKRGEKFQPDALEIAPPSKNVIIDHCSTSWGIDEVLSVSGAGVDSVTVQWTIISEGFVYSYHRKGGHSFGSLIKTNGQVSFHHNLFAHHKKRSPGIGTYGNGALLLDFRNNLIHDSLGNIPQSDSVSGNMNYIGNYISRKSESAFRWDSKSIKIYAHGNFIDKIGYVPSQSTALFRKDATQTLQPHSFPVMDVATSSAQRAYRKVLKNAGAILPARDGIDQRIVCEVREKVRRLIDSQREVGGWPPLRMGEPDPDQDADGMADNWETSHGCDPQNPIDGTLDMDKDGYTNLEEFMNGTNPKIPD